MNHYHRGEIIRMCNKWGVCIDDCLPPLIDWLNNDGTWYQKRWYDTVMFVVSHDSIGIPDEVLARATAYKLVDTFNEPDTKD